MKWLVGLLMLSSLTAGAAETVKIQVKKNFGRPETATQVYRLTKTPEGFSCSVGVIPEHPLRMKGLRSLAAPFKGRAPASSCRIEIRWGKAVKCYAPGGPDLLIDEILRKCATI